MNTIRTLDVPSFIRHDSQTVGDIAATDYLSKIRAYAPDGGVLPWSTWVCISNRPDSDITYINNWPGDEQVSNVPGAFHHLWSGFSATPIAVF